MAFVSRSSIYRLATMGLMGDPLQSLLFAHSSCSGRGNMCS